MHNERLPSIIRAPRSIPLECMTIPMMNNEPCTVTHIRKEAFSKTQRRRRIISSADN